MLPPRHQEFIQPQSVPEPVLKPNLQPALPVPALIARSRHGLQIAKSQ